MSVQRGGHRPAFAIRNREAVANALINLIVMLAYAGIHG